MSRCCVKTVMHGEDMKEITIDELQARLEHYLDQVRRGDPIRVIEGGRALAEIARVMNKPVIAHEARGQWSDIELPESNEPEIDIVKYLLEDRGR